MTATVFLLFLDGTLVYLRVFLSVLLLFFPDGNSPVPSYVPGCGGALQFIRTSQSSKQSSTRTINDAIVHVSHSLVFIHTTKMKGVTSLLFLVKLFHSEVVVIS